VDPSEKIAVIGCGNWGKNLVRNFYNLGFLAAICDLDKDSLVKLQKQYPGVQVTTDFQELIQNPELDALVISTPSHTHYKLAKAALMAGKHVYVEKPIATSTIETQELFTLSEQTGKVLMVGHLLLYHPVVNRLKQLIAEGYLGEVRYLQSDRLNFNPHRGDRSVFWDLAPHDLSMMMYILNQDCKHVVSVEGSQTSDDGLIDIAHIEIEFANGVRGHIHNSWVHPLKQVKLIVRGSERTAVIDDTLPPSEKLQVFSNTASPEKMTPESLTLEPLKLECQHFINCIRSGRKPKSDGINGLKVVQILEEAEHKIYDSGLNLISPSTKA
jgi:UDP-2-acetamido-3-amino-2,3-dideoxy-glucuronate N-acetyltransferase